MWPSPKCENPAKIAGQRHFVPYLHHNGPFCPISGKIFLTFPKFCQNTVAQNPLLVYNHRVTKMRTMNVFDVVRRRREERASECTMANSIFRLQEYVFDYLF
jgi:hypothetical protein